MVSLRLTTYVNSTGSSRRLPKTSSPAGQGVGLATLQRIEQTEGIVKGNFSTVLKIQKALEQAGIHFMEDDSGQIGVQLEKGA